MTRPGQPDPDDVHAHAGAPTLPLSGAAFDAQAREDTGDRIGPYRLLEVIGEGGFGVVWAAERREPIVQRVALKIIKPGMDSRQVIARFEQERQALALMNHPNIAQVFDAGATPSGRPYFVMELVKGEPITHFCDRHKLSVRERLELFLTVCDAVQHAHYRGIIHRDLKPSNILVGARGTEQSGNSSTAVIKVIDFGVAKAITHSLTDKTIFTESGSMIGTPEYMSPEQADMREGDVDTRTDVFSLGVVMYELLVGDVPFDSTSLRAGGFHEMARIIRECDAPRPSTRLRELGAKAETLVASNRRIAARSLSQQLRGELELIPLKALRKQPAERYASPNDLARDIRAYLAGRPIEARPPSALYFTRKFITRHKRLVLTLIGLACITAVGVKTTLWQAQRADAESLRAKAALEEQTRLKEEQAAALAAASAWINISCDVPGARALCQRVESATLQLGAPIELGPLPLRHFMMEPAQYRVTIVTPDAFAEFNAVLLSAGQANETSLVAAPLSQTKTSPASSTRTLHARLIGAPAQLADMVRIPAGTHAFGWSPDAGTLNRAATVTLPEFWIDVAEVSNGAYKTFTEATGHAPPRHWTDGALKPGDEALPVVGVTLEDAEAYARWCGKRLPTAFEWQAVARGPDGRRYPWGSSIDDPTIDAHALDPAAADLLAEQSWNNGDLIDLYRRKALATTTADPLRRANADAVVHLYDNVREISGTLDLPRKDVAVLGRCWADSPRYNDLARVWTVPLSASSFKNGFRCAKSAAPPNDSRVPAP